MSAPAAPTCLLRPAQASDADALDAAAHAAAVQHHALAPRVFADPPPEPGLWSADLLAPHPQAATFVAELDGRVVGFVRAMVVVESRPLFQPGTWGKIDSVAVLPGHRGRGIGSALMARAEQWLAQQGCPEVRLNVWSVNARAVSLYARQGYAGLSTFLAKPLAGA